MKNKVGGFPEDQEFMEKCVKMPKKWLEFCDGFMLGRQHTEKLYGKEGENKDED